MKDQWVTDSFYTSFPSFKKQDLKQNTLADDRRDDYRKYLAETSNKKFLDDVKSRRKTEEHKDSEINFLEPPEKLKLTARDKLLDDLKHSDLSFNFHNPDAIQDRNQKVAIERTRKKVELQEVLKRQIEEKKLKIEKLRAKEKEEDELLQRRLENQMKALHMTDLAKKNAEKVATTTTVNQTARIREEIPRSDLENGIDFNKTEDDAPKNRIKSNVHTNNDRQIYKFFSNSAPHNDCHVNNYNHPHPVGFNSMQIVEPLLLHQISTSMDNPNQQCNRCTRSVPILCNSCCHHNPTPSHFCCYRCNLLQNMDVCGNCRRAWVQTWNRNSDVERCGVNIYQRDNRPQILEITYQDHGSQTDRSVSPLKDDRINATRSPTTSSNQNSHSISHKTQTESEKIGGMETILPNVPETVPLSKEDEILELKRKNDILIAKYARNYGSLRNRKSVSNKSDSQLSDDSFPLPLMREHLSTSSSRGADSEKRQLNSQAVRQLEYKWEIPVVQKQVLSTKPTKVLTQVGAIAKQLQLEKLNFGSD